ncbi:chemotaxis protein CheW [Pantanalinema rosaneae CENA516]|uniref:chemotaxis protein CheW n=1 Tax=Pantanalinema rosaneae TaxID=1620701 RepID=UPI003D6F21E1
MSLSTNIDTCWHTIGITGDRSCPELSTAIHCRNCPVYAASGRKLLEREAPVAYQQEWTDLLTSSASGLVAGAQQVTDATIAVVLFRLRQEWLALTATLFQEVTTVSTIHTLPHRSNQVLLGLVNIRGELQLCVSLANLLGLETTTRSEQIVSPVVYPRMVVVQRGSDRWVFPVDELYGVHRMTSADLYDPPASVTKALGTYTKQLIRWQHHSVSFLDEECVFQALSRRVV